jgi:hypothetical protein
MVRKAACVGTALLILITLLSKPCFAEYDETKEEEIGRLGRIDAIERHIGRTRIGGWVDFLYKDTDKQDSKQFFDLHHFYLYFDNELTENWRAFAELEFEHVPELEGGGGSGELKLERGYIQYTYNDHAKSRLGKFNTPLGIWTPTHWAIYVDTVTKPIHEDNKYVPVKQVGIEFFGSVFPLIGDRIHGLINYAAYFSNGSEVSGTNKPEDDDLGGGVDINATFNDRYLIGISAYTQHNPSPRLGTPGRREDSLMLYGEAELPYNILLRSEYFIQDRTKGDPDIDVIYAKIKWGFIDNWYVNYRWNQGDDDKNGNGREQTMNVFTLSYWPLPEVRIRSEFSIHDFKDPGKEDFNEWIAWIGYIF